MKIGTIGTGFIVDTFMEAVQIVDEVEVVAVYSRTKQKAEAFASKYNVAKTYCDIDEMFADEEIDTIYVASPNSLHYSYSLKALQAKKHVICEKPFTSTIKELDALIAEAKKQKVFLWEAITNIYTPNLNIIKDALHEVGEVRLVTCNFSQYSSRYAAFKNGDCPNVFNPEYSGGSIMDINLYNIHLCMYLFGKPNTFHYYPNIAKNGIDTSGVMIFQYDNFIATLIGAKDSASANYACIQGDEGSIVIDGASTGVCKEVKLSKTLSKTEQKETNIGIHQNKHMSYELIAFETMLRQKDYATCEELLAYSREVLEVIETARKAAGIYFSADQQ
ncbi:MAG: Gfo/Idh/MocA family oxidoreductase [Erysipelotrichia bacterium]|nr:Gfo/Idh/MocA family oxidoreductase [Erysipelotrichia bacterium]NCC54556.1 Gfo/Idh/MocA family oxidoreductase [Erysipelotrichia bacterium]